MSELVKIPSPHDCQTEQYQLMDGKTEIATFQVFNGVVEHVNDIANFWWAKSKNIQWVQAKYDKQEQERLENLKKFRTRLTDRQKEILLWQEEQKKIVHLYTEGEMRGGELETWK